MVTAHRGVTRYQPVSPDRSTELLRTHRKLLDQWARAISTRTGVDADDLWSAGALALIDAVDRFDSTRGAKMQTFLAHRVRGAMLDEVRRYDRLPRRLRDDVSRVKRAQDAVQTQMGRPATSEEIASATELSSEAVSRALLAVNASDRISVDFSDVATDEPSLDELLIHREDDNAVQAAITTLPERTQTMLSLRYVEDLTLREIAGVFSISEARVCQLLRAAVSELRAQLR